MATITPYSAATIPTVTAARCQGMRATSGHVPVGGAVRTANRAPTSVRHAAYTAAVDEIERTVAASDVDVVEAFTTALAAARRLVDATRARHERFADALSVAEHARGVAAQHGEEVLVEEAGIRRAGSRFVALRRGDERVRRYHDVTPSEVLALLTRRVVVDDATDPGCRAPADFALPALPSLSAGRDAAIALPRLAGAGLPGEQGWPPA